MAIIWQTQKGNLGTVANSNVITTNLVAISNQTFEANVSGSNLVISPTITYTLIAGSLPTDLSLETNSNIGVISGTVSRANQTQVRNFTIRATETLPPDTTIIDPNITLKIADRSFSYYWIGPTAPIISDQTLDSINSAIYYSQTLTVDNDATSVTWATNDALPPNLTLLSNGTISGYLKPNHLVESFTITVNAENNVGSSTANITFPVVRIGADYFSDSTNLTADTTNVTADYGYYQIWSPVILDSDGTLLTSQRRGTAVYQVIRGIDYNGDNIEYNITGDLPPGLTGSNVANTFVINGTIANSGFGTSDYDFSISPTKSNSSVTYTGDAKTYTITVLGEIEDTPVWTTPANLGVLDNSVNSQLYVEVISASGLNFTYRLTDSSNPLPDGLELKSDGTIVGRIKADISDGVVYSFSFEVEAKSNKESVVKTFTVQTNGITKLPYRNLYLRLMPKSSQRSVYSSVINNTDIIPYESLYRPLDPWFGVNKLRRILFSAGLEAKTFSHFVNALVSHHWWKNLRLGEIKTAVATNENLESIYEIIYLELIDDARVGDTIPKANVTVGSRIVDSNSFYHMARQIANQITYEDRGIIPLWMRSRQSDGKIPGFKIVFPLVYVKPGKSAEIANRISALQQNLSSIEFTVDRYEFDGDTVNSPTPIILSSNTEIVANNTINIANIVGQTSVTLSANDYKFLNSNRTELELFDGMKLKFTSLVNNEDYRFNTYVVGGVGSNITLIPIDNQTVTTTSNVNGNFIIGANTFFATNVNQEFAAYQIHNDDWIVTGNGNVIIGKVEDVISNTVLKLNANFTITTISSPITYQHTNWIPQGVPVKGDKYLKFPRIKVYNVNE